MPLRLWPGLPLGSLFWFPPKLLTRIDDGFRLWFWFGIVLVVVIIAKVSRGSIVKPSLLYRNPWISCAILLCWFWASTSRRGGCSSGWMNTIGSHQSFISFCPGIQSACYQLTWEVLQLRGSFADYVTFLRNFNEVNLEWRWAVWGRQKGGWIRSSTHFAIIGMFDTA